MKHFHGCKTLEDAKRRKRELLLTYHPDRMNVITQQIASEWEDLIKSAAPDGALPELYHVPDGAKVIDRIVYRDRVVEKRVEIKTPVYVDRVIEKRVEVKTPIYVDRVVYQTLSPNSAPKSDQVDPNDRTCDYSAGAFG
jgi:hypothetical protein